MPRIEEHARIDKLNPTRRTRRRGGSATGRTTAMAVPCETSADSLRREFTVRIFDLNHIQASTKSSILVADVNSRRIRVRA